MPDSTQHLVLAVEDSLADQEILRRAFQIAASPCELRILRDGESALSYLQQSGPFSHPAAAPPPDLILLDLNLPNLTGRELLERIRSNPSLRHIPIIIFTTTYARHEILECYRLGANAFLTKPAAFQDVADLIQATCTFWLQFAKLPPNSPPGPVPSAGRPVP